VPAPIHRRDLIVVGASAGGVEALRSLVAALPPDLNASVCVVLHVLATGTSVLPGILNRAGPLPARHAADGDPLVPGEILVAPPNWHLLVEREHVRVTAGPKENGHRPAIDALFRTAARSCGSRVAGVVLSGSLDDGTAGLRTIKICGGATLVQDPDEALYSSMPVNAIAHVRPDHVLRVPELATTLARLAAGGDGGSTTTPTGDAPMTQESGRRSNVYTCPDCGGALEESVDEGLLRFRCKVGHQFSEESFTYLQSQEVETSLWAALRALEDRAELMRRVAGRMRERGGAARAATRYDTGADDARKQAATLRRMLEEVEGLATPDPAAGEVS
jgi:two-component system chemotaxis response regulator CheB